LDLPPENRLFQIKGKSVCLNVLLQSLAALVSVGKKGFRV
jgi:hypothetical protein